MAIEVCEQALFTSMGRFVPALTVSQYLEKDLDGCTRLLGQDRCWSPHETIQSHIGQRLDISSPARSRTCFRVSFVGCSISDYIDILQVSCVSLIFDNSICNCWMHNFLHIFLTHAHDRTCDSLGEHLGTTETHLTQTYSLIPGAVDTLQVL